MSGPGAHSSPVLPPAPAESGGGSVELSERGCSPNPLSDTVHELDSFALEDSLVSAAENGHGSPVPSSQALGSSAPDDGAGGDSDADLGGGSSSASAPPPLGQQRAFGSGLRGQPSASRSSSYMSSFKGPSFNANRRMTSANIMGGFIAGSEDKHYRRRRKLKARGAFQFAAFFMFTLVSYVLNTYWARPSTVGLWLRQIATYQEQFLPPDNVLTRTELMDAIDNTIDDLYARNQTLWGRTRVLSASLFQKFDEDSSDYAESCPSALVPASPFGSLGLCTYNDSSVTEWQENVEAWKKYGSPYPERYGAIKVSSGPGYHSNRDRGSAGIFLMGIHPANRTEAHAAAKLKLKRMRDDEWVHPRMSEKIYFTLVYYNPDPMLNTFLQSMFQVKAHAGGVYRKEDWYLNAVQANLNHYTPLSWYDYVGFANLQRLGLEIAWFVGFCYFFLWRVFYDSFRQGFMGYWFHFPTLLNYILLAEIGLGGAVITFTFWAVFEGPVPLQQYFSPAYVPDDTTPSAAELETMLWKGSSYFELYFVLPQERVNLFLWLFNTLLIFINLTNTKMHPGLSIFYATLSSVYKVMVDFMVAFFLVVMLFGFLAYNYFGAMGLPDFANPDFFSGVVQSMYAVIAMSFGNMEYTELKGSVTQRLFQYYFFYFIMLFFLVILVPNILIAIVTEGYDKVSDNLEQQSSKGEYHTFFYSLIKNLKERGPHCVRKALNEEEVELSMPIKFDVKKHVNVRSQIQVPHGYHLDLDSLETKEGPQFVKDIKPPPDIIDFDLLLHVDKDNKIHTPRFPVFDQAVHYNKPVIVLDPDAKDDVATVMAAEDEPGAQGATPSGSGDATERVIMFQAVRFLVKDWKDIKSDETGLPLYDKALEMLVYSVQPYDIAEEEEEEEVDEDRQVVQVAQRVVASSAGGRDGRRSSGRPAQLIVVAEFTNPSRAEYILDVRTSCFRRKPNPTELESDFGRPKSLRASLKTHMNALFLQLKHAPPPETNLKSGIVTDISKFWRARSMGHNAAAAASSLNQPPKSPKLSAVRSAGNASSSSSPGGLFKRAVSKSDLPRSKTGSGLFDT